MQHGFVLESLFENRQKMTFLTFLLSEKSLYSHAFRVFVMLTKIGCTVCPVSSVFL